MRHYEVLFIVKPTLTEDEVKTKVDFWTLEEFKKFINQFDKN